MDVSTDVSGTLSKDCTIRAKLKVDPFSFCGTITALQWSHVNSMRVFVASGACVYCYDLETGESLASVCALEDHIIHGFDILPILNASNDKVEPEEEEGEEEEQIAVFGQKQVQVYRFHHRTLTFGSTQPTMLQAKDWIFDAQLLQHSDMRLAIGLGHNAIQIWDFKNLKWTCIHELACATHCIIYALVFSGRTLETLEIASGTVFQQILLWSAVNQSNDRVLGKPHQVLEGHEGVILKLEFSPCQRYLASVSDDRTLQLFHRASKTDDFQHQFRAFGHTSRIWDVAFLMNYPSDLDDRDSDDDLSPVVVTSSADGTLRLWDIHTGLQKLVLSGVSCPALWTLAVCPTSTGDDDSIHSTQVISGAADGSVHRWNVQRHDQCTNVPQVSQSLVESGVLNRSKAALRGLRYLANSKSVMCLTNDGQIWQVLPQSRHWITAECTRTSHAPRFGTWSNVCPEEDQVVLADVSGHLYLMSLEHQVQQLTWDSGSSRHLSLLHLVPSPHQNNALWLFSSGMESYFCRWTIRTCGNNDHFQVTLDAKFAHACQSSCSSLLLSHDHRRIYCGDGRGFLYVHELKAAESHHEHDVEIQDPLTVVRQAHGYEHITSIALLKENSVLRTTGNDGILCTFNIHNDTLMCIERRSVGQLKKILAVSGSWIFGFLGDQAILYDLEDQYQVFAIPSGGYRRHHAMIFHDRDGPVFIRLDMVRGAKQKTTTVVTKHVFRRTPNSHQRLEACGFHERLTTSVAWLNDTVFVTGSEGNTLQLHARASSNVSKSKADDDHHHHRGMTIVHRYTAEPRHTKGIKALAVVSLKKNPQTHQEQQVMILSAGGNHALHAWTWSAHSPDRVEVMKVEKVIDQESDSESRQYPVQEQRINCMTAWKKSDSDINSKMIDIDPLTVLVVVVTGNSAGIVAFHELDLRTGSLTRNVTHRCGHPILSCAHVEIPGRGVVVVTGSTTGTITLWWEHQAITHYRPHAQGVNGLAVVGNSSVSPTNPQDDDGFQVWSVGEDQNLHVAEFHWHYSTTTAHDDDDHHNDHRKLMMMIMIPEIQRQHSVVNATGSAIKTIRVVSGHWIVLAGYDQRVHVFYQAQPGTRPTWQHGHVVQVADITTLEIHPQTLECLVVGRGCQVLHLDLSMIETQDRVRVRRTIEK